jgi:nucleotide-binding universal stress UspA family protein
MPFMLKSKVLLPSDGSPTAIKAEAYAARLMKLNPDMKLDILVIVQDEEENKGTNIEKDLHDLTNGPVLAAGQDILNKTLKIFVEEGQEVGGYIEQGDPASKIVNFAEKGSYDHIIMGSRGVSQLRGTAIGSVSHQVIQQAKCRVTLVK